MAASEPATARSNAAAGGLVGVRVADFSCIGSARR
jgi:hypothetical protein